MDFLYAGPASAKTTLILAHGAGGPMDTDWMNAMADALARHGVRTARFEFGYMAARRTGERKPPSPANVLIGQYVRAIETVEAKGRLLIGGKSMGGRMASMIADKQYKEGKIAGLVCLGYPFHPPGQPEKLRTDHLENLACPTLIFQGERDPFGTREEVAGYPLSKAIDVRWMVDGDHDLKPRKASGATLAEHMDSVAAAVAAF
ncbi:MAG: alpha/beta hydrolase [Rhizobiaceae bacterium]|nr:alpha/beta hydrolase [Rhizobiaceae bacterium]